MTTRKTNTKRCSAKAVSKKFKELKYMTNIPHTISTGNKTVDKMIGRCGAKAANIIVKSPKGKLAVRGAQFIYPYVENVAANLARAKVAYDETCRKRK